MPIDITKLTLEEIADLKKQLGQILFREPAHYGPRSSTLDACSGWDWSKTNSELSAEHKVTYPTVYRWRRALGVAAPVKRGKWFPACKDWDWSRSDTEIARQNSAPLGTVKDWRRILGKPHVERESTHLPPLQPAARVDYNSLDWSKHDAELARETGRTRERIRQMRAQLGKPKNNRTNQKFHEFKRLFGDRKSMNPKEASAAMSVSHATAARHCRRLGIEILHSTRKAIHPWHLMNWQLPNLILEKIWRFRRNQGVAQNRYRLSKPPPAFRFTESGAVPDVFLPMVDAEKAKAAEHFAELERKPAPPSIMVGFKNRLTQ